MHETRTLAECVAQTQFGDLPPSLVDECKIAVLDTFGAACKLYDFDTEMADVGVAAALSSASL